MLIVNMLMITGSFFLMICALLCVFAVGQGRGRRKLRAHKQMLFARVMDF
jgi:hypothetical protein